MFTRGNGLITHIQYPPKGSYPFADQCHDLMDAGYLNGASVGFVPDVYELNAFGGKD